MANEPEAEMTERDLATAMGWARLCSSPLVLRLVRVRAGNGDLLVQMTFRKLPLPKPWSGVGREADIVADAVGALDAFIAAGGSS